MLQKDKYSVINIRKYLESDDPRLGEEDLTRISKNSPTSIGGEMNCHLLHSAIVGM